MSAGRWGREFGGLALSFLASIPGWIVIGPLALAVPKRRDWIAVIGRQHGKFLDNTKYFYLQAHLEAPAARVVFVSELPHIVASLSSQGWPAMRYPSPKAIWYLLRCRSAVVDSTDWGRHLRRYLLVRARVFQLWHGVGFKRIELDKWRHETGRYRWFSNRPVFALRLLFYRFTGRLMRYRAVCSTSVFYRDEVFRGAFLAECFPVTGYPRNTFGRAMPQHDPAIWMNVDAAIKSALPVWRAAGRRVIVVAPTIRDSGSVPMRLDRETVELIDRFCASRGFEFVFKFHPSESAGRQVSGTHLHVCDPNSDLYPLLPEAAAMVTDYSSIYMDYLLVDRPILFLIPEDDSYVRQDRQTQFNPATMMPGPVVRGWNDLLAALENQCRRDDFIEDRARLRRTSFDDLPQDRAVPEILKLIGVSGGLNA